MMDFEDRLPTEPNRYTIVESGGYATIERADLPINEGTPLNREAFMAIQGFIGTTTVFNANGSIVETNTKGDTLTTVFNSDGSITNTFVGYESGKQIEKTTSFSEDGSITETISAPGGDSG